jgi:O-antigen ligase
VAAKVTGTEEIAKLDPGAGTQANGGIRVSAVAVAPNRLGLMDATAVLTGYVILVMLFPSNLVLPGLGGVGTPANVYALLALLWYFAAWLSGRLRPAPSTRSPRLAMALFTVAVLLSYIADAQRAPTTKEIQAADRGLIALLAWITLVVLASAGIHDFARLNRLLRRIVICASIVAAIGIAEFFTGSDLVGWVHIPGLQTNMAPVGPMSRGDFTRPRSTATQPLEFGAVMTILLPFAIQQAFDPARLGRLRRWLPVGLLASALPMTVSRTSVIGAGVVLLVLLPTWRPQRRWPALIVIALGAVAMRVVAPGLIGTIVNLFSVIVDGGDSSTKARTGDYDDVFRYISQRPLLGRGFQTFLPSLYRYTDNMYLLALVEIGVVGMLSMLVLYLTCLRCGATGRRCFTDPAQRELGQAFVAAASVALVCSATFDTLSFPMFAGLFILLLGCSGTYLGLARRAAESGGIATTPNRRESVGTRAAVPAAP